MRMPSNRTTSAGYTVTNSSFLQWHTVSVFWGLNAPARMECQYELVTQKKKRKSWRCCSSPGMSDKVVNWDLNCLPLQDQSQRLHNQLIVKGICREKQGRRVHICIILSYLCSVCLCPWTRVAAWCMCSDCESLLCDRCSMQPWEAWSSCLRKALADGGHFKSGSKGGQTPSPKMETVLLPNSSSQDSLT